MNIIRHLLVYILLILLISCNYRIYHNGRFKHKYIVPQSDYIKSNYDSIFLIGKNDRIPDSIQFVAEIEIRSPDFPFQENPFYSPTYKLIERAKDEAHYLNANLIQINYVGLNKGWPKGRFRIKVKLYHLKESNLFFKKSIDSITTENKNLIVVHLKNYYHLTIFENTDSLPIFYNSKIINYVLYSSKNNKETIYKFNNNGFIASDQNGLHGLTLYNGHEYYIKILRPYKGHFSYLQFCSKFDF